jgi:hypothetical protein
MNASLQSETPKDAARRLSGGKLRDGYKPTALYRYNADDGSPWVWRIRCDHPTRGKWMRPMHFDGMQYVIGEPPAPKDGKPLYSPPYPLIDTDPVFVVEGEGKADALAKLGMIAVTSGSCTSADAADWAPLRGRGVRVWPDNDAPGAKYADTVLSKLHALGVSCDVLDVSMLELPDKGDCVDWLRKHPNMTAAEVLTLPARTESAISAAPIKLPDPLPSVPTFNPALLPIAVREWCEDSADALQVPLDFTAIPAMIALAGTIGRRVGMAMKRHARWIEMPMLWGCVVGRPSSGKSPALSPARKMLERLATEERKAYEAEQRDFDARAMIADASKANAKKAIQAALKKGDKLAAESAADDALFDDDPPTEPRILVNDATVEKLGELLKANPRGLVQYRDELAGWLANLDREGREGDRAFWLECWNGTGTFTVDRIGRGTIPIEACAMSILGGMQPGKLAEYVRGAVRGGFADDGLMQRFQMAVYPDLPSGWTYSDRTPNPQAEAMAWATFQRLRALDPGAIGAQLDAGADVPFLRFDDEAQDLFIEWYTEHMQRLRANDEPAWMESHLAKFPGLVGRLALVLHLADDKQGPVSADTLAMALNWCDYLEGHARRIYSPATDNGLTGAHLILKRRSDLAEPFTARELYRRCWVGLSDPDAVQEALDVLAEHRYLDASNSASGGRPTVIYAWGPY